MVSRWCSSWVVFSGGFFWFGFLPRSVWCWGALLPWGILGPNENPTRGEPSDPGGPPRPEYGKDWAASTAVSERLMAPPSGVGLFSGPPVSFHGSFAVVSPGAPPVLSLSAGGSCFVGGPAKIAGNPSTHQKTRLSTLAMAKYTAFLTPFTHTHPERVGILQIRSILSRD